MLKQTLIALTLGAVTVAFSGTGTPVAQADSPSGDGGLTDRQVVSAVEKAGGSTSGPIQSFRSSGNTISAGNVTMTIPHAPGKGSSVSGTHTYRSAKVNYAVRGTTDGIQAFAVVTSADATREFTFTFPGKVQNFEQGLVIIRAGSATAEPLAVIDPAWAKDSTGKSVTTWFSIVGTSTLVQRIDPDSSTAYPVVADPRVRWASYGASVDFSRGDTQLMAWGGNGVAIVGSRIGGPIGNAVTLAGAVFVVAAGAAVSYDKCLSAKFTYANAFLYPIWWITSCYA